MNAFLKKASKDDCDLLFNWANDVYSRENSFNSSQINYDEHVIWFDNKLNSNNSNIYIFYYNSFPVGQARIDIENNEGIISYSIDNYYRGQGLSKNMLCLLEKKVNNKVNKLIAFVKYDNIRSQRKFEQLDYTKLEYKSYIKYYKVI